MSLADLMTRTVQVRRRQPAGPDAYGNDAPRASAVQPDVLGYLEQLSGEEQLVGANTQLATHLLVLPAGTAIDGHDQVVVDGDVFEVVGPESRPWHPRTGPGEHHVEVRLRYVEG